ncbi:MAG TPA: hypothetical protein VJR48_09510 [Ktedonobacterales bacterium]|nr:hypothetical protein [Ktedonobacterales bacterium]
MHPFGITNRRFLLLCLLGLGALALPALGCSLGSGTSTGTSTPAATATPNLVIYKDALDGSTKSDWADDSNCFFGAGGYHIKASFICYAPSDKVGDGVITVSVTQLSGPVTHAYGLVFRRPSQGNYYEFLVDSNGKWIFDKVVSGTTTHLVDFTANAAIVSGLNKVNTLSVQAQGSHFVFSVNGTQVGTADDTTFTTGDTGLSGNDGIEVVFTNLLISKLSS